MAGDTDIGRLASRGAYASAVLFVALIIGFSTLGSAPAADAMLVIGLIGASAHLALLPAVAAMPAPNWIRACGYAWLLLDVVLNVASVNGAGMEAVAPLRLGGHIPGGIWIASVAGLSSWDSVRRIGIPLGSLLVVYSFVASRVPAWVLFIPFVTVPIWLAFVGRQLQREASAAA